MAHLVCPHLLLHPPLFVVGRSFQHLNLRAESRMPVVRRDEWTCVEPGKVDWCTRDSCLLVEEWSLNRCER